MNFSLTTETWHIILDIKLIRRILFSKKKIKFIYLINWSGDWFQLVIILSLVRGSFWYNLVTSKVFILEEFVVKLIDQDLFALIIRSKPKRNSVQFKLLLRFRVLFTFISMAIKVSSNQTIMPNEGVSQSDDLLIFDAIQQVRLRNERQFSYLQGNI